VRQNNLGWQGGNGTAGFLGRLLRKLQGQLWRSMDVQLLRKKAVMPVIECIESLQKKVQTLI
jgi:hypothetical protein